MNRYHYREGDFLFYPLKFKRIQTFLTQNVQMTDECTDTNTNGRRPNHQTTVHTTQKGERQQTLINVVSDQTIVQG